MSKEKGIRIQNACLFGDSIAKGVFFDDISGKYAILKNNFAALAADSLGFLLNNRAKFGCTITKGHEVISRMIAPNVTAKPFDYAFLEFGGNDCDFNWKEIAGNPCALHLPNTPLPEFISVYEQIIRELKENDIVPVIMTLPPLAADSYFQWFSRDIPQKGNILEWLGGDTSSIYYWHERYNSAVWEVAYRTDCRVIDIRKAFLDQRIRYKEYLCTDGIHLNQAGHTLVYQTLMESAKEFTILSA